ncbi:MAG: hypothetical protein ACLRHX_13635 [Mediterraneibacter gnavus]
MRQAEFAELSREVMPVLDKLTEIAPAWNGRKAGKHYIECRRLYSFYGT